jgi:serine/threonine-protein kinase
MIGKRLGHWVIEKQLGRGGMGAVYLGRRAEDAPLIARELAAIKVLGPELAAETGFLQRFQREVDALRLLDHPNIVRFYESGVEEGRYFYAMEYIDGKNFEELMEGRRIPWRHVLAMALQVTPALKHAHDHGIIHRDLKPQNLMCDESGTVKLADFGVAKVFATRQLTATGGIVGTAEYISPEQASGKPVTPRSDLYSFGVVLYLLLTGRLPFQGGSIIELIHQHRYAQFDEPSKFVDDLPREFDEVVCSLMAKEPGERPANALVLMRLLESIQRKMDRKESMTVVTAQVDTTKADNKAPAAVEGGEEGPATLMSRLMRQELHAQNRGSALGRFFNHPATLVAMLLVCLSLVAWRFWPASAEALFARGERLMQSNDPDDWDRAERECFTPLDAKYPGHAHAEAIHEYRERIETAQAERGGKRRGGAVASEAHRFYLRGQRQRQEGDLAAAERTFTDLVTVFDGVPAEEKWVRLARKSLGELRDKAPAPTERFKPVRAALARTKDMKRDEAEKVWTAIEALYRDDPGAAEILKEIGELRKVQGAARE